MPNLASNDAMLSWLREQLDLPVLPSILTILRTRRAELAGAAMMYGDTNKEKTQVAELTFVIDLFEHFEEYADTGTETVAD